MKNIVVNKLYLTAILFEIMSENIKRIVAADIDH